jgi:hypothetical protein
MKKISLLSVILALASLSYAQNTEETNKFKEEIVIEPATKTNKEEMQKEMPKKQFNTNTIQHKPKMNLEDSKAAITIPEKSKVTKTQEMKVPPSSGIKE